MTKFGVERSTPEIGWVAWLASHGLSPMCAGRTNQLASSMRCSSSKCASRASRHHLPQPLQASGQCSALEILWIAIGSALLSTRRRWTLLLSSCAVCTWEVCAEDSSLTTRSRAALRYAPLSALDRHNERKRELAPRDRCKSNAMRRLPLSYAQSERVRWCHRGLGHGT